MKVLATTLNAKFIHSSLALRYLKGYAELHGQDMTIEEYTINMPIYDILRDITRGGYDVIGFACYIWNIEMTLHLCELIKEVSPFTTILLGGPEVSYTADEILLKNPSIDYILQGEGEEAFLAFLTDMNAHGEVQVVIPGIRHRNAEGELVGSTEVVEVLDLDSIPFPYSEEDMEQLKHRIVYYESSRGCPFSCQYCLSGNQNKLRFFSLDRVMQELQWFMDHGVRQVKFVDRTFNAKVGHHRPMMKYLAAADTNTNFHLEMEGAIMTEWESDFLCHSPKGRFQIEVGLQSTHEETLTAVRRRNDWEHIQACMKPIIEAGRTHVHMDLIVGLPHESYAIFKKSFSDLFSLAPQALQIGFLKLLRGSGVSKMAEYEYRYDRHAPYEVLATHVMSYEEMRFLKTFEDVFEHFYNSEHYVRTMQLVTSQNHWVEDQRYFTFFERLAQVWLEKGNHHRKLNDLDKAIFLYEALPLCAKAVGETEEFVKDLQEACQLDVLLTFKGKIKHESLGLPFMSKEDWKAYEGLWQEGGKLAEQLPEHEFVEWRRVKTDWYPLQRSNGEVLLVDVLGRVEPFVVQ